MSESRRIHLYSLILPLGLCLVLLIVNPNFIYKLFAGGLALLISLTYVLALVYIGLTLQPRLDTPRNASISALLGDTGDDLLARRPAADHPLGGKSAAIGSVSDTGCADCN